MNLSEAQLILLLHALADDFEPSDEYVRLYGRPSTRMIDELVEQLTTELNRVRRESNKTAPEKAYPASGLGPMGKMRRYKEER